MSITSFENLDYTVINPFKDIPIKHTPVDVILFTEHIMAERYLNMDLKNATKNVLVNNASKSCYDNMFLVSMKAIGAFKVAHECRLNGFSTVVVDFCSFLDIQTLKKIVDKFVGENTLAIGISTTFLPREPWEMLAFPTIFPFDPFENIKDPIKLFDPYLGFLPHGEEIDDEFCAYVKQKNKNIKFIKGGAHTKEFSAYRNVDIINVGYGDITIPKLLTELRQSKPLTQLPKNSNNHIMTRDLTSLLDMKKCSMKWEKYDVVPGDEVPIEMGRGCIFRCSFCNFSLNGKEKGSYTRSLESIKQELENNYYEHGIYKYWFTDDTFNDDHDKIIALHKMISELDFKIQFSAYIRLDLLWTFRNQNPPQHQLLKEMGMTHAEIGIESINYDSAKDIGKGMDPELQFKYLRQLKTELGWENIYVNSGFIVGLPSDTKETLKLTAKILLNKDNPLFVSKVRTLRIYSPKSSITDPRNESEFTKRWRDYGYKDIGNSEYSEDELIWENKNGLNIHDVKRFCGNFEKRLLEYPHNGYRHSAEAYSRGVHYNFSQTENLSPGMNNLNLTEYRKRYHTLHRDKIFQYFNQLFNIETI
jgi:radical SAM superfamily enzyme YgiQ (UPF0313 family)